MALITHRDEIYRLIPKWARGFNLFSVLYAIAMVADALGTALFAAVKIRFPGYYSNESLPRIGSERRLSQGPNETPESFAERLSAWWDTAKLTGNFLTMAQQIQAYCLPATYRVELVSNNGNRHILDTDGSWTVTESAWDWDGDATQWSRFWVLLANTALGVTGTDHVVMDPVANVLQAGRDVGSDTPYLNAATSPIPDHREIRRIMELQRDPHTQCEGILLLIDPNAFWADMPDGTWDRWANRNTNALYWAGTPL